MNITDVIEAHAEGSGIALYHRDREISYTDLFHRVRRLQAGMEAAGIRPGDRVMIIAGTTPDFVSAFFAVLRMGAVAVPVNPLSPPPEMRSEIKAIEPALIFVGPAGSASLGECEVSCPVVALPGATVVNATDVEAFVVEAAPPPVSREPDDLALLLFTSGTAGAPKAAMLTHGNLQANISQVEEHAPNLATADDVALVVLPLFHILGLNMLLGVVLRSGAAVVLVERFDPARAIEVLKRHQISLVSGPPAMWQAWTALPGVSAADFATVRVAVSGAAGLPREVAARVQDLLGLDISQGYGLTEAAPVLTLGAGTGAPATSVGRPVPGVTLRLVDTNGDDVPVGDEGEVWARGDNIFLGYWNDPAATAEALTPDGWLRTGDIAVVDDDGFLYIVDRTKDLIVVSGFNVFPGEVEEVLAAHDGVSEAAVVGTESATTGEAVKAFVVANAGAVLDEDELVRHCESRLARYKCPESVEVVAHLPRGGTMGKLRRRELR